MTPRSATLAVLGGLALPVLHRGLALAQCAMCGTAIQSPDEPLARGLFWSVLFLISLPYTIVAGFIAAIAWGMRRSRRAQSAPHLHTAGGARLRLAAIRNIRKKETRS